jgi:hypothetical protein
VDSFSPLTLGSLDDDSPLPVKWLSFTASRETNGINLDWKTAQERNNDHFEIERSVDGRTFNAVGTRTAVGNSSVTQRYQFIDKEVSENITYYYRIRQVDFDGNFDFSSVVAVMATGKSDSKWAAWPNPINDQQKFQIALVDQNADATVAINVQVVSSNGMVIYKGNGALTDVNTTLEDLLHNLTIGVYVVLVSDGITQQHFRIVRY